MEGLDAIRWSRIGAAVVLLAAIGGSRPILADELRDITPAEPPSVFLLFGAVPEGMDGGDSRLFRTVSLLGRDDVATRAPEALGKPEPEPLLRTRSGLRNSDKSFGRKILRGEAIIGGVEVASLGVLLLMPKSVTKWDDSPLTEARANLKRAWSRPPVWDKDIFFHNFIGHPYAGSIYYNMARSQGATRTESFLFSTMQCVLFEYLIEAVAEQPSIQDLTITSTVGSLLGEAIHRWTLKMVSKDLTFWQKAVVLLLNPSYVVNNGFRAP
ncbi:MAG: DUF3943 domain-containing protein [Acidobacteriota bacterium]